MALSVPEAVVKFRQGFGRLMRRASDYGMIAVLDNRLVTKTYGRVFLASIPQSRTCFDETSSILRTGERFFDEFRTP
jgi:ATP-dependent DNA helicase DinG